MLAFSAKAARADRSGLAENSINLENGNPAQDVPDVNASTAPADEYVALNRFISTAGSGRRLSSAEGYIDDGDDQIKKKRLWKIWHKSSTDYETEEDGGFSVPEKWLETEIHSGLKTTDIEPRRRKCGWNELSAERQNPFIQFLGYFRGPILYGRDSLCLPHFWYHDGEELLMVTAVMEWAVCLAGGLRDWIDFGVIIGILMLNALVGWYQEKQAADVVASLKGDIAMRAVVIRNDHEEEILARELVVGDIVILEEGRVVPADALLICDYDKPEIFGKLKEVRAAVADEVLHEKPGDEEEARSGNSNRGRCNKFRGNNNSRVLRYIASPFWFASSVAKIRPVPMTEVHT